MSSAASAPPQDPASPFSRALDQYLDSRQKKSKTPNFIQEIQQRQRNGDALNQNAVKQAMVQLERDSSDRVATSRMRRILGPVVSVLNTYACVIDTFCQADPMPTAIIWGCLKAAIQCSSRFLDLYDKISDQLGHLKTHIEVLTAYEELFGESSTMQELLQNSYVDIIRFWRRVEKECTRCIANRMSRAIASFSVKKLDDIIANIDKNAERITLLVPVVQERSARGEREDAAEERRLAGMARDEAKLLYEMHAEELKKRNEERKRARKTDLGRWLLGGASQVNESNHRHQEQNTRCRNTNTCAWILNEELFINWLNPTASSPVLWVKAAPGVGKSILTAYAIEETQTSSQDTVATCFQYYSFDEEFSALQVLRALTEQLSNQLWEQTGDIPEDIHALTQKTTTSSKTADVENALRETIKHMKITYVFLDGLDEECDNGPRWRQLKHVLDFLTNLVMYEKLPIKIWCSSQPRTCVDSELQLYPTLQVTPDLNKRDIERFLKDRIDVLDDLELDEGYQNVLLADLRSRADGCFLWASLMLDSISNASSLQAIQEYINDGLPKDYERYYMKKLESIAAKDRALASVLLACIVHAKRPLRLEELCEATAATNTEFGQDIDRTRRLFKKVVTTLCQPLVRVHDVETAYGTLTTCTLTHATVRNFLLKQTHDATLGDDQKVLRIVPDTLADICLKYLMQSRFAGLLSKNGDVFEDNLKADIDEHHLLPYAAKYWDKHLDVVKDWQSFSEPVRKFVFSPQFFTCLQVQSLLVGGQFQFWYNSNDLSAGPHIKRVFPAWLGAQCNQTVEHDYRLFISDWGYLLDEVTGLGSSHIGEIDRCFFGTLGSDNFLATGPSRYTSFQIRDDEEQIQSSFCRYFDSIDERGLEMVVLGLQQIDKHAPRLEFECQQWDVSGSTPTLTSSQKLPTEFIDSHWLLYDLPASTNSFGKPSVVAFSSDLAVLRIASQIYKKDNDGAYQRESSIKMHDIFVDEIASRHRYVAITTRRDFPLQQLTERDAQFNLELAATNFESSILGIAGGHIRVETDASTNPTTTENTDESRTVATAESDGTSVHPEPDDEANDSDDLRIEDASELNYVSRREGIALDNLEEDDPLLKSDSDASDNSAEEEWSDGSSDMLSDEVEDEDQWNDWGNERLTIEEMKLEEMSDLESLSSHDSAEGEKVPEFDDLKSLTSQMEELDFDEAWEAVEGEEIKISGFKVERGDTGYESDSSESEESSVKSGYSPSNYSDEASNEDSDYEEGTAKHLDALIFGKGSREGKQRITINVHNLHEEDSPATFHFTRYVKRGIFDSPPVFHPSKPLLVWPLGDAEILFADYKANTFFTRLLCCSRFRSCHIWIKAHFSPAGEYVHFAALEAQTQDPKSGEEKGALMLSLQISTHRLSVRKTTRSPPRLMYRTTVNLSTVPTLNISSSPYTLHWTDKYVYLTTNAQTLDVTRISLFPSSTFSSTSTKPAEPSICTTDSPLYLPRTTSSRTVHFFPPPPPTARALSQRSKTSSALQPPAQRTTHAKVIIGSHSASPSRGILVPAYQIAPPMGVLVDESKDLGGWKCRAAKEMEDGLERGKDGRVNNAGGRLQGKFETFDRGEDCDIVPFLY